MPLMVHKYRPWDRRIVDTQRQKWSWIKDNGRGILPYPWSEEKEEIKKEDLELPLSDDVENFLPGVPQRVDNFYAQVRSLHIHKSQKSLDDWN